MLYAAVAQMRGSASQEGCCKLHTRQRTPGLIQVRFSPPPQNQPQLAAMSLSLAEWLIAADAHTATAPRSAQATVDALRSVVSTASGTSLSKECKAWLASTSAATAGSGSRKRAVGTAGWSRSEHLLCITQAFPELELEVHASTVLAEALSLLRPHELLQTHICGCNIVSALAERLLCNALGAVLQGSGRKAAFVSALPKLVPAVLACVKQHSDATRDNEVAIAACLHCLCSLLHALRNSMRPYLARIEGSIGALVGSSSAVSAMAHQNSSAKPIWSSLRRD